MDKVHCWLQQEAEHIGHVTLHKITDSKTQAHNAVLYCVIFSSVNRCNVECETD